MQHYDISGDPRTAGTRVALEALGRASRMTTHNVGVVSVPNADGTSTVIGSDGSGGADIDRFVGDVTAPGRPTGITARCVARAVIAEWAGTLDGGVPPDFDYCEFILRPADGGGEDVSFGDLRSAGSLATAQLEAGTSWLVVAVAVDAQRNRSAESDPVRVDVEDKLAETALKADQLADQITDVKVTVTEQGKKVEGAIQRADQAVQASSEAKQTVNGFSDTVNQSYQNSKEALNVASDASQTASDLKKTVEGEYVTNDKLENGYYGKTEIDQSMESIDQTVLGAVVEAGKTNLTPFFQRSPSDKAYWSAQSYWVQAPAYSGGAGWALLSCDNTAGTAPKYPGFSVAKSAYGPMPGRKYQVLVEIAGLSTKGSPFLVLDSYYNSGKSVDSGCFVGAAAGGGNNTVSVQPRNGVQRVTLTARDLTGVNAATKLTRSYAVVPAGAKLACYIRLSLFLWDEKSADGTVWHPYVQPTGTLVRQTPTGMTVGQTDGTGAYTGSTHCAITGSAFQVVDKSGTVKSQFAGDSIDLGRDSDSAVISLCKGSSRFTPTSIQLGTGATDAVVSLCKGKSTFSTAKVSLMGGAATFAAKAISLGVGADDAVVSLCNGRGEMSYDRSNGRFLVSSATGIGIDAAGGEVYISGRDDSCQFDLGSSSALVTDAFDINAPGGTNINGPTSIGMNGNAIRCVRVGTVIVTCPAMALGAYAHVTAFTAAQFSSLVGRAYNAAKDWVGATNADWNARHVTVTPVVQSGNVICFLHAPVAAVPKGPLRLNYVIVAGA